MKRIPQDTVLAVGVILALALLAIGAALIAPSPEQREPPLSSLSYQTDGAKGLKLWLQSLGFEVREELLEQFDVAWDIDLMLLLQPTYSFTAEEKYEIYRWVLAGGHLVVVGDSMPAGDILAVFNCRLIRLDAPAEWSTLQSPLLQNPPVGSPVHANARFGIREDGDPVQVHLAEAATPIALTLPMGSGDVTAVSAAYPFSNAGILDTGNAAFVYNLIVRAGGVRTVWFDEWHHGQRPQIADRLGPMYWLFDAPAGRGVLFALVVIWLGLLLAGRKFGAPVRIPSGMDPRMPVEYAGAIARLHRRAGHRRAAARHYRHMLKMSLASRYPLDPLQADDRFVDGLAHYRPDLDRDRLRRLLRRLSAGRISERELVDLAGKASDWIDRDSKKGAAHE
jgi:hypothetical protein